MTNDELIKHRLKELEEFATGARQTERDVDTLKLAVGKIEQTLTEIKTEQSGANERTAATLARLHERLDSAMTKQAREDGREAGRAEASTRTWKVVAWTVTTTTGFGLLIVAALNFALN